MTSRLPDFLIIGAFKSGTTSLTSYLGQHPRLYLPWIQEPNFFGNENFALTMEGDTAARSAGIYARRKTSTLGQYCRLFEDAPEGSIVGESSPQYMRTPGACERIRSLIPDVKLIAILRNPVDRAFSDYSMFVRDGLEHDPFEVAVRRPRSLEPLHHYVETGMYGQQLRPFFDTFPREQLRVHLFEDLVDDPRGLMASLFSWLGADPGFTPDFSEVKNVSGVPRNPLIAAAYIMRRRLQPVLKPRIPSSVQRQLDSLLQRGLQKERTSETIRRELVDIFADDIAELASIIDRDLSSWLRVAP